MSGSSPPDQGRPHGHSGALWGLLCTHQNPKLTTAADSWAPPDLEQPSPRGVAETPGPPQNRRAQAGGRARQARRSVLGAAALTGGHPRGAPHSGLGISDCTDGPDEGHWPDLRARCEADLPTSQWGWQRPGWASPAPGAPLLTRQPSGTRVQPPCPTSCDWHVGMNTWLEQPL